MLSLILLVSVVRAEVPAQVQSQYGQLVTSSTLSWVVAGAGLSPPPGSVDSGTGSGLMCRTRVEGVLLAGQTEGGRCWVVGEGGRLTSVSQYSVLSHQVSASKLEWRSYRRFSPLPSGAVAGVDTGELVFLARRLEGGLMVPAQVEVGGFGGNVAVYSQAEAVRLEADCDVLVEVEPVRYELSIDTYHKSPISNKERKTLATSSMFRFEEGSDSVARMTKMLSYTYEKSLYFGHIKGTIKGLPTKVKLPTGERKTITWGRTEEDKQQESIMVGHNMNKNTAVDITVSAQLVTEEQPWQGRMRAVFSDGSGREREVEGVTITSYLDMIQPSYSVLYQIKEQELEVEETSTSLQVAEEIVEETFEMFQDTETSAGAIVTSCTTILCLTTLNLR